MKRWCVPGTIMLAALVALLGAGTGCQESCGSHCTSTTASDGGVADGNAPDVAQNTLSSLMLTPGTVTLVSVNGARPRQVFSLTAVYPSGATLPVVGATFTVEPANLGDFAADTLAFTSNGLIGGTGTVKATVAGLSAQATITVRLEQTVVVAGAPADIVDKFAAAGVDDPMRAAKVIYPLEGAVMPQNLAPADVQWEGSAAGDYFRVGMRKPNVQVAAYTAFVPAVAGFADDWVVDDAAWKRLAQSDPDASAEIVVDRYEAATQQVIKGVPVKVRFARAAILGAVYYWDIAAARIVRIPDGRAKAEQFLPSPQLGCIGCHAVSHNGRYMAGRLGPADNEATVYDLTKDLTGNPPPTVFPVGTIKWYSATWNPEDTRLAVTSAEHAGGGGLKFVDPYTGTPVPVTGPLPTGQVVHPSWSPDGKTIAYVKANAFGGENTAGDIFALPVTGPDQVGEARMLLAGTKLMMAYPGGAAANYPSWTTDSKYLAFAHGTSSRSENGRSALYFMAADGTGVVRMDKASGGAMTDTTFQPRFSPFRQGGYFWLSFLSRRDYGNARAGTKGQGLQQIWVSALKDNPKPGEDPSEVPYWLPGQSNRSRNISAFWAAQSCQAIGDSCKVDAECCSGDCQTNAAGADVCVALAMCRAPGLPCTESAQCCQGLLCVGSRCGGITQP